MPIGDGRFISEVMSALTGRETTCLCTTLHGLQDWFHAFGNSVVAPVLAGSGDQLRILYGRLRDSRKAMITQIAPDGATFPCKIQSYIRMNAYISGL